MPSGEGLFETSGEGNPNFYEHRAVFVPYCSSDMWLGDDSASNATSLAKKGYRFRGRVIMNAVLEDLASIVFTPTSVPTPHHPRPVQGVLLYACDSIEQHEHRESLLLLLVLLMHQVRGSSSSSSSSTPPPRPAHAPG